MPIKPNTTHVYRFQLFKMAHIGITVIRVLQEQIGMYGNFIMLKKSDDKTFRKGIDDLPTVPIVLSRMDRLKTWKHSQNVA